MTSHIHFIGIGGIGMSAVARGFLAQKWAVSGSDIASSDTTRELKKEGAEVKIGHKKGNIPAQTELVVYNMAIPKDNPEIREAKRRKIPLLSYPEVVGTLTQKYRTVAVAGAHGKSTTTGMASVLLMDAGLDPTVIVGTKLRELKGKNFRAGKSQYFVLEADDAHKAFLHYSPTVLVVTNIDREHMDHYKDLGDIKRTFLKVMENVREGGMLVLNRDDKNLYSLKSKVAKISKERKLKVEWYSVQSTYAKKIRNALPLPGAHNLSNACAVFILGKALRISEKNILDALHTYRGSWRRMEYKGKLKIKNSKLKISVYDDYAHHPTEIKATLRAFREQFPDAALVCVFQPHQVQRLQALFQDFISAFDDADALVLFPIYRVSGRDRKPSKRYTSRALAGAILRRRESPKTYFLRNPKKFSKKFVSKAIKELAPSSKGAVIVMMGAGDIVEYTKKIINV